MVLDATVGGDAANSYLDVATASDLLSIRFGTAAWDSALTADKEKALMSATADIDTIRVRDYKVRETQALQFPRSTQLEAWSDLPKAVKWACVYQALHTLQNQPSGGQSDRQQLQAEGVTEFKVGHLEEKFGPRANANSQILCARALRELQPWISRTGDLTGPRQTERESRFWYPFY
jgi:hypothetical protein